MELEGVELEVLTLEQLHQAQPTLVEVEVVEGTHHNLTQMELVVLE